LDRFRPKSRKVGKFFKVAKNWKIFIKFYQIGKEFRSITKIIIDKTNRQKTRQTNRQTNILFTFTKEPRNEINIEGDSIYNQGPCSKLKKKLEKTAGKNG
jgi:hypothetical protein